MTNEFDEYRPLQTLSFVTMGLIGLQALSALATLLLSIVGIVIPVTISDDGDSIWMILWGLVSIFRFPAYIGGAVLFLIWLNRASKNLPALKAEYLEFTPGWAVGWWFVPFANLVKPFQVVREIWYESDPEIPEGPSFLTASLHQAPTYMAFWWGFWLFSNILGNLIGAIGNSEEPFEILAYFLILDSVVFIIAALLAIYVIRDITHRQELRYQAVGRQFVNIPPPQNFGHEE